MGSTAFSLARGLGGGSDVFFLTKSGARFRQSSVEQIVESAWVTVQRAWPSLNTGPKLESDIGRKLSVKWQNRWPDVLYHNAILQGSLRSAFLGREVEAGITRTMRAPKLLPQPAMSFKAQIALSGAAGGGPLPWQEGEGTVEGTFLSKTRANAWEYGTLDQMRDFEDGAMASRAYGVGSAWAHALPGVAAYEFYHNAREGGAGFGLAMWGAALSSVPGVSGTYQLAGYDIASGDEIHGWSRALGALDVAGAVLGGAPGVNGALRGTGRLAREGGRLAATAAETAVRAADRALIGAAERTSGAARWMSSAVRKSASRAERFGTDFAEGFSDAYRGARRAQLSRVSSDPLLGLGNEAGNLAEGISGGAKRAFSEARIAERRSAELLGRDGTDIAEYVGESAQSTVNPILRTQKELSLVVNRQAAVVDRWLATSQNRWARNYRANLRSNPNFAKGIRGRILDVRTRPIFKEMYGDAVHLNRTIPGATNKLRPDIYFPDLGGRRVIFDVGGPSKIGEISKYSGMADDVIPLVPEQWF